MITERVGFRPPGLDFMACSKSCPLKHASFNYRGGYPTIILVLKGVDFRALINTTANIGDS